jgi:hypothetical protein
MSMLCKNGCGQEAEYANGEYGCCSKYEANCPVKIAEAEKNQRLSKRFESLASINFSINHVGPVPTNVEISRALLIRLDQLRDSGGNGDEYTMAISDSLHGTIENELDNDGFPL